MSNTANQFVTNARVLSQSYMLPSVEVMFNPVLFALAQKLISGNYK